MRICFLTDGYLSGYIYLFPGKKTLIILASTCTKCKHAKSGAITCNYAHVAKNCSESRHLSNEHCAFSRIQISIYIIYTYIISHRIHVIMVYMVTWIPSIYPLYVSIYSSTMDPMGIHGYTYIYIWCCKIGPRDPKGRSEKHSLSINGIFLWTLKWGYCTIWVCLKIVYP